MPINYEELKALFFQNKGVKQVIIKNTFWLSMTEAFNKILKLFLVIYIARVLGAAGYGEFNFALAFASLFIIFTDFGIPVLATRELANNKEKEKHFPALLALKLLLTAAVFILTLAVGFFTIKDSIIRELIFIFALMIASHSLIEIVFVFFRARQRMEYEAWIKIIEAAINAALGFFVLFNFPSPVNLSWAYSFAAIIALVASLVFLRVKFIPLKLEINLRVWKEYFLIAWPLALVGFFTLIYTQTDSVMMGFFKLIKEVGWYSAALKIVGASLIPAGLVSQCFFPALASAFKHPERLQKIWNYFLQIMIFFAVPVMVGGIVLAQKIIDFVYDPSYFPAILAFQILILTTGINYLCTPFNQLLIVLNQQKKMFWAVLGGALTNVILNSILIPRFTLYGAAAATVISMIFIFSFLIRLTFKLAPIKSIISPQIIFTFTASVLASLPMYFAISRPMIYNLNIFLSILVGASVYTAIFSIFYFFFSKAGKGRAGE